METAMNRLNQLMTDAFKDCHVSRIPPKLYAVIHALDRGHGIEQARIAIEAGAHGIALIDQFCEPVDVYEIAKNILPSTKNIAVNILRNSAHAFAIADHLDIAVWVDSFSYPVGHGAYRPTPVFQGCGFKYQSETELQTGFNLAKCQHYHMIPMTSGPGTGQAPDLDKIVKYHALVGPLAIASGITPENVSAYVPYASHFFVGTAIKDEHKNILADRIIALDTAIVSASKI